MWARGKSRPDRAAAAVVVRRKDVFRPSGPVTCHNSPSDITMPSSVLVARRHFRASRVLVPGFVRAKSRHDAVRGLKGRY